MFRKSSSLFKLYWKHKLYEVKLLKTSTIVLKYGTPFEENNKNSDASKLKTYAVLTTLSIGVVIGAISFYTYNNEIWKFKNKFCKVYALENKTKVEDLSYGIKREELPTFSMEEVNKHDNQKSGIWITYKEGVYNVTDFVKKHPGGTDKIMMAAGGTIHPYWVIFANHNKPEILTLLESMRIGNLKREDVYQESSDTVNPYALEPVRNLALKINGKQPFCAEPPAPLLVKDFETPSNIFYVRNHLPVPLIDLNDYELEFAIEDKLVKSLKLEDIKKYPKYTITSAIMCGGNRRSEMNEAKPLKGLRWNVGAVGNASWSGARLCDILHDLAVKEEDYNHVQFEGMDIDLAGVPYGASIPISKAFNPRADVIVAYEMNGKEIPLDHGFPVRVIVPGVVGARNVKWLNKIIFSKYESPSQFQQNDYKGFSPNTDWDNVDFSKAPAIQEMPVTSAICIPEDGDKITIGRNGTIQVKGYAWSGGGKKIIRVDVTANQGQTWHTADLVAQDKNAKVDRHYAWTLWSLQLPITGHKGPAEIWVKAVDSSYNVQPETFKYIWNLRGFLCNAYHRVKVEIV